MPRKPKATPAELPAIPAELLEQFSNGPMTADAINAATRALKKALTERALGGEMNHHLERVVHFPSSPGSKQDGKTPPLPKRCNG